MLVDLCSHKGSLKARLFYHPGMMRQISTWCDRRADDPSLDDGVDRIRQENRRSDLMRVLMMMAGVEELRGPILQNSSLREVLLQVMYVPALRSSLRSRSAPLLAR